MTSIDTSTAVRGNQAIAPTTANEAQGPGKSAEAVGHRAKAAIAAASEGQTLPANIQGKVASALARGLPLDSILALQPPADDGDTVVDDATLQPDAGTDVTATPDDTSTETADATALELLEDADQPETATGS